MTSWLLWYFVTAVIGWLAFPIAYRLLPVLPDRGYISSRVLGLLIWGFILWLLASLGILPFNDGGLLFAALLLSGLSLWALLGIQPAEMVHWLHSQKRVILATEALFLVAFAAWAFVRAANPEAIGTEKPMELAFINAILRSPGFPPHDPWLSGYAISYYYFGYVIIAMLAKITGTAGSVAFNLGISLVFALSACGAYGLVYNLLNSMRNSASDGKRDFEQSAEHSPSSTAGFAFASLLGPLFVLFVSNLEGFLHMLHNRGLFWIQDAGGSFRSPFWRWLDLQDLSSPPLEPFSWIPNRFWWWWRASRVLQDYDLSGSSKEIIDEFPFFSYLLADLHPHVLAMPFAFLAITLALGVFLSSPRPSARSLLAYLPVEIPPGLFLLGSVALGGMAFLNTWDFPVYVFIFAGAYALNLYLVQGKSARSSLGGFFWLGGAAGICGILLYLPFYLGFSSQAGGILPNLIYPTRGAHLWVMFAPLLVPILAFLILGHAQALSWKALLRGFGRAAALILGMWAFALLLGFAIIQIPVIDAIYLGSLGATNSGPLFQAALSRRLSAPGGWLTLLLMLGLILGLVPQLEKLRIHQAGGVQVTQDFDPPVHRLKLPGIFVVLLILTGLLLVLTPEFIYLRDLFGWRMNTIFKFYFQAWLIWSIAAAFGVIVLLLRLKGFWRAAFYGTVILLLSASLVYPVLSLLSKTASFQPVQWTLDAAAYYNRSNPDEMSAIEWLKNAPYGTVAEAVPAAGGSYSEYARVSTFTGLPAVLGWVGHENQWRGSGQTIGTRQADLEKLFCSRDWDETRQVLEQYQIRYVFVGGLERIAYQANSAGCPAGIVETKFQRNLNPIFEAGQVVIYEFPGTVNDEQISN